MGSLGSQLSRALLSFCIVLRVRGSWTDGRTDGCMNLQTGSTRTVDFPWCVTTDNTITDICVLMFDSTKRKEREWKETKRSDMPTFEWLFCSVVVIIIVLIRYVDLQTSSTCTVDFPWYDTIRLVIAVIDPLFWFHEIKERNTNGRKENNLIYQHLSHCSFVVIIIR